MNAQAEPLAKPPKDFYRRLESLLRGPTPDWNSWVVLIERDGEFRAFPVSGRYWPRVAIEAPTYARIYVFRGDGLLYRTYQRVWTYPKTIDYGLELLPRKAVELMWRSLNGLPLRQYRNS